MTNNDLSIIIHIPIIKEYIKNQFKYSKIENINKFPYDNCLDLLKKDNLDNNIDGLMLIIRRIALKIMLDYEKMLLAKCCIDQLIHQLEIFESRKEDSNTIYENSKNISKKYSDMINNLNNKYNISKSKMLNIIYEDLNIYKELYKDMHEDIKDELLNTIDNTSRQMGIILFTYGRMGRIFDKLYEYYYDLNIENNRAMSKQFNLIILWIKFMHISTNYSSIEMTMICNKIIIL